MGTYRLPLSLKPALVGIRLTLGFRNEMQIINIYDFSIYMPVTRENIQTEGADSIPVGGVRQGDWF